MRPVCGLMVRDGAEPVIGPRFARTRWRLLTMRVDSATSCYPASAFAKGYGGRVFAPATITSSTPA
jgi:hypothetical protein